MPRFGKAATDEGGHPVSAGSDSVCPGVYFSGPQRLPGTQKKLEKYLLNGLQNKYFKYKQYS